MARATAKRRETLPTPPSDIVSVTLVLHPQEAQALRDVLIHVGGPPAGPRGDLDNIAGELDGLGFVARKNNTTGQVYFN